MDPVEIVRQGYDQAAERYMAERTKDGPDVRMLDELESRLNDGDRVLDLGCGAGRPIAARLARRYSVTGIDLSETQIRLARDNVPNAEFRVSDMIVDDLGTDSFDGVVSYYAIIHVPREHHRAILAKVRQALKPGGVALLCLGANDLESDYGEICATPMYWSHFDANKYLEMLPQAGLNVELARIVPDISYPGAGHLFVVAQKP